MRKIFITVLFVAIATMAHAQGARWDYVLSTTPGNVPAGSYPPILSIPGATIAICAHPATMANGVCTNKVTTYTDSTLSTPCSNATQVVLPGTSSCVATTDAQGNFGVFVTAGAQFDWTATLISGQHAGPFTFTTGLLSNCPASSAGVINSVNTNGILTAACFSGSDWIAKTAAAIAALPKNKGTVFVPSSLSSAPASTALSIPANIVVVFDVGVFQTSNTITYSGNSASIECAAGHATTLQFTGATDGITVMHGTQYHHTSNCEIQTTNASGGSAIMENCTTDPCVLNDWNEIHIDTASSGKWAYGNFRSNEQHSNAYHMLITGFVNIGWHFDTSANEDHCYNCFMFSPGDSFRGVEVLNIHSDPQAEIWIDGGGIQGGFTGSLIYITTGEFHMSEMHSENTLSSPSDGADVVLTGNSGTKFFCSNSQIGTLFIDVNNNIYINECAINGPSTISSNQNIRGIVEGSNINGTLTDNGSSVAYLGNTYASGAFFPNRIPVAVQTSISPLTFSSYTANSPSYGYNTILYTLDSSGQPWPFLKGIDSANDTYLYYKSGHNLFVENAAGTIPSTTQLKVSDSGTSIDGGRCWPISVSDTCLWRNNSGIVSVGNTTPGDSSGIIYAHMSKASGGTVTITPGVNVATADCTAGYTCLDSRGTLRFSGGTATTGTIATINFSTTLPSIPVCVVSQSLNSGGSTNFGLSHFQSTSSITISSGGSVSGAFFFIDYQCTL